LTKQQGNKPNPPEKLNPVRTRSVLIRLGRYILKHFPLFLLAILLTLLSNQLALMGPNYSGEAIDALVAKSGVQFDVVWDSVGKMLVCYVISAILAYVQSVLMIHISQKIVYAMRKELFGKLTSLPVSYFDTHATGDIISHISYDIDTVNTSLSHDLVMVMTSVYTVVGSFIYMWRISKPMILIFVVMLPASVLFARYRSKKVRPLFRKRTRKLGELNGFAEEMLSGCRTIQAYGRENEICGRFDERNSETVDAYYDAEYYGAIMGPGMTFINNLSITMVAVCGGILYMYSQNGTIDDRRS